MSAPKDDDSTDIEVHVKQFMVDMGKSATDLLKKNAKSTGKKPAGGTSPPASPSVITFKLSTNKTNNSRTPGEQAALLAAGSTQVCWSAHMTDRARDILMLADGKNVADPKKIFPHDFGAFKTAWAANMKKNGLKNHKGEDGWGDGDGFHLELPDSKIARTDERAKACLKEYVRLTREGGKKPNTAFESKYSALLKPLIDAANKKSGQSGTATSP